MRCQCDWESWQSEQCLWLCRKIREERRGVRGRWNQAADRRFPFNHINLAMMILSCMIKAGKIKRNLCAFYSHFMSYMRKSSLSQGLLLISILHTNHSAQRLRVNLSPAHSDESYLTLCLFINWINLWHIPQLNNPTNYPIGEKINKHEKKVKVDIYCSCNS